MSIDAHNTEMPRLDTVDPAVTSQVIALRAKVQQQGDPLLLLRLDEILFLDTTQEKVDALKELLQGVSWRDI